MNDEIITLRKEIQELRRAIREERAERKREIARIWQSNKHADGVVCGEIRELWERIKLIEPCVYPKLGDALKEINDIIRPADDDPSEPRRRPRR